MSYTAPLDQLLSYGDPLDDDFVDAGAALEKLGITAEHIPELVRMANDPDLHETDEESLVVWAPVHAINALLALGAEQVLPELLPLLDLADDWILDEISVFATKWPNTALPIFVAHMEHDEAPRQGRATAVQMLGYLMDEHPERAAAIVPAFLRQLEKNSLDDRWVNAVIVGSLADLQAEDALPAIEDAVRNNRVETSISGSLREIREDFGRDTVATRAVVAGPQPPKGPAKAPKDKSKRKAVKAARKKNRKK